MFVAYRTLRNLQKSSLTSGFLCGIAVFRNSKTMSLILNARIKRDWLNIWKPCTTAYLRSFTLFSDAFSNYLRFKLMLYTFVFTKIWASTRYAKPTLYTLSSCYKNNTNVLVRFFKSLILQLFACYKWSSKFYRTSFFVFHCVAFS